MMVRAAEWYKENMSNPIERLEKKNLIVLTGAFAGITRRRALKYGFICVDILFIADTVVEMILNRRQWYGAF